MVGAGRQWCEQHTAHVASWLLSASAVEEEVSGTPQRCDWAVWTARPVLLCSVMMMRPAVTTQRCCTFYCYTSLKGPCTPHTDYTDPVRPFVSGGATCLRVTLECYVTRIQQVCRKYLQQIWILQWLPPLRLGFVLVVQNIAQRRRPRLQLAVIFFKWLIHLTKVRWVLG